MSGRSVAGLLAASLALTVPAAAEVIDTAAGGFTVRTVVDIAASPQIVYTKLSEQIGSWWDSAHTYSGDAARLSIDPRPGGCFCERLDGGGVQHMEVVYAQPATRLRLQGGLGPLQGEAVTGRLTFEFEETGEGTRLSLVYKVVGYVPTGLAAWAAPVDGVLTQAVARLKRFVETGSPTQAGLRR